LPPPNLKLVIKRLVAAVKMLLLLLDWEVIQIPYKIS